MLQVDIEKHLTAFASASDAAQTVDGRIVAGVFAATPFPLHHADLQHRSEGEQNQAGHARGEHALHQTDVHIAIPHNFLYDASAW